MQDPCAAASGGVRAFSQAFGRLLTRAENREAMACYIEGLLSDLPRKTASEIGRWHPHTNAQRLQEFLTRTQWSESELGRMRAGLMLACARSEEGVQIVRDFVIPKHGMASVGAIRGSIREGDQAPYHQSLIATHFADAIFDWPIGARLYLSQEWASDSNARARAGIPDSVEYRSRAELALAQVLDARSWAEPPRLVMAGPEFGGIPDFVRGLERRGIPYLVEIDPKESLEVVGQDLDVARPAGRYARLLEHWTRSGEGVGGAAGLANQVPDRRWKPVAWLEPGYGPVVRQFVRVRALRGGRAGSVGWWIVERPAPGYRGALTAYFAWGADHLPLDRLARYASLRHAQDRFFEVARRELGLTDYQGRLWAGFHRHLELVMLAYCYRSLRASYEACA